MASAQGFKKVMLITLAILVIGVALWTWLSLSWAYSEGERAGILQKFSKKGWVCKTYEGEIALYVVGGVAPQPPALPTRRTSPRALQYCREGQREKEVSRRTAYMDVGHTGNSGAIPM
jgi:hypothetical protein